MTWFEDQLLHIVKGKLDDSDQENFALFVKSIFNPDLVFNEQYLSFEAKLSILSQFVKRLSHVPSLNFNDVKQILIGSTIVGIKWAEENYALYITTFSVPWYDTFKEEHNLWYPLDESNNQTSQNAFKETLKNIEKTHLQKIDFDLSLQDAYSILFNLPRNEFLAILDSEEVKDFIDVGRLIYDYLLSNNNLANYEEELRQNFSNVRLEKPAEQSFNEAGVVLTCDATLYAFLSITENDQFQFEINAGQYQIFIQDNKINQLITAIDHLKRNPSLGQLALNIQSLKSKIGETANQESIESLKVLLCDLKTNLSQKDNQKRETYQIITRHFCDLTSKLNNSSIKFDVSEIKKSFTTLDEKLYGKPPMSHKTKGLICGVIGALVGFALGLTVGAIATSPLLGFGAIPGAIVGAIEGFTIGTAVGLGTSGAGLLSFGLLGTLHANKKQIEHKAKTEAEQKNLSETSNKIEVVKNHLKKP